MSKILLKAELRKIEGRKVKKLRKEGILPGNVYGKKIKSESVQVNLKEFEMVYREVGETGLVTLVIGTEEKPVLVHNLQLHAKTDEPLHVDFLQVDLKEKVEADIPVEMTGESPAEKGGVGTVVQYINEIKVEALPTDLPERFVIDISELSEVDQCILIKDLKFDKTKVEIKNDLETIVAKVEPPQKEEVAETQSTVEGETPVGEEASKAGAEGPNSDDEEKQKENSV